MEEGVSEARDAGRALVSRETRPPLEAEAFQFYSLVDRLNNDPAAIGFPPLLPIEIVLRTAPVRDICEAYGITADRWERLRHDGGFIAAVKKARDLTSKEGWSFKIKALMQSEELLKTSWTLIHSADTPAAVKADLIKGTWRAAGVSEPEVKGGGSANNFQININLG